MWFNIIKNKLVNIQSTGLKVTTPNIEEVEFGDGPCNRKLKQYADKLRNMGWKTKPNKSVRAMTTDRNNDRIRRYYDTSGYNELRPDSLEHYRYSYVEIPEEVACKALDLLSTLSKTSLESRRIAGGFGKVELVKGYKIRVNWEERIEDYYYEGRPLFFAHESDKSKLMSLFISQIQAGQPLHLSVGLQIYVRDLGVIENMDEIDIDWR
jgi:hypothetical protein